MKINYSDQRVIKGKQSIFLAGPTPRNKEGISWRVNACKLLGEKGCYLCPRIFNMETKS